MDFTARPQPQTEPGRQQVAAAARQAVDEDQLVRAIPRLEEPAELIHRQQIEDDVNQAVMDKVAGDDPPDLAAGQIIEAEVSERFAPAKPEEQPARGREGGAGGEMGGGHRDEDDEPGE